MDSWTNQHQCLSHYQCRCSHHHDCIASSQVIQQYDRAARSIEHDGTVDAMNSSRSHLEPSYPPVDLWQVLEDVVQCKPIKMAWMEVIK